MANKRTRIQALMWLDTYEVYPRQNALVNVTSLQLDVLNSALHETEDLNTLKKCIGLSVIRVFFVLFLPTSDNPDSVLEVRRSLHCPVRH